MRLTYPKTAQNVGVHPVFCDEISERFAKKLELCSNVDRIHRIFEEMYLDYCRLCREYSTRRYSPAVKKTLQYIQLNLSQDLSLKAVARSTSLSPDYLSHCFKAEVGVPLSSYVTTRRIEEACRLLTHSFLPVREIAGLVGIPDWNYFTKLFRKEKGCTPREYRKTMLPT